MFALDYRDARPIYQQICDGFCEKILSGVLHEGDRLPSVRELSIQLTINPNTIQRSYRQLEAEGWIACVPGKGCFVCGVSTGIAQNRQLFWEKLEALRLQMALLGISTEEIIHYLTQGEETHA